MVATDVITQQDVIDAYAGWNGTEAAEEAYVACPLAFMMTANYLNEYEYDKDDDRYLNTLATTLDVLRKAYGGDFQNLHEDGNYRYEYCNAAEEHVAANPKHKATVEYSNWMNNVSMEVACRTEMDPEQPDAPHWWDHVC